MDLALTITAALADLFTWTVQCVARRMHAVSVICLIPSTDPDYKHLCSEVAVTGHIHNHEPAVSGRSKLNFSQPEGWGPLRVLRYTFLQQTAQGSNIHRNCSILSVTSPYDLPFGY